MVQAPHGPSILKDTQSTLGGYVPRLVMSETWNQCRGSSCGNHVTSTSESLRGALPARASEVFERPQFWDILKHGTIS